MGSNRDQEGDHSPETGDGRGRKIPSADEIVIPADLSIEAMEADEAARRDAGDESRPGRRIMGTVRRWPGRIRRMFDCILLIVAFVLPLSILGIQSLQWLRHESWSPVPLERGIRWLQLDPAVPKFTSWSGLNEAMTWLFDQPLALVLFLAGLALHVLSGLLFPRIRHD